MRDFRDDFLARLPPARTAEAVAGIALAVEAAAEERFSALARALGAQGAPATIALLEELAGEHSGRADRLRAAIAAERRQGPAAGDLPLLLPRILADDDAADCARRGPTPYRVLAFSVGLARRCFKLYSYIAAGAEGETRLHAERLASAELARAAHLRSRRRQAFREERTRLAAEAFPRPSLVDSRADFLAAALAIESRLAERLDQAGNGEFAAIGEAARQETERLHRDLARAGETSESLVAELAAFSRAAGGPASSDATPTTARQRLAADCERAFGFYDAIASRARDEAVMLRAQALSQTALDRIRRVRALAGASDGADRLDRHWPEPKPPI